MPSPLGDRLLLRVLRESRGVAGIASEEAIRGPTRLIVHATGIDAAPEGGCALIVLRDAVKAGKISKDAEVVIYNTGQRCLIPRHSRSGVAHLWFTTAIRPEQERDIGARRTCWPQGVSNPHMNGARSCDDIHCRTASCLTTASARAYGSEGWGFESLRARSAQRRLPSLWRRRCWFFDDSSHRHPLRPV